MLPLEHLSKELCSDVVRHGDCPRSHFMSKISLRASYGNNVVICVPESVGTNVPSYHGSKESKVLTQQVQ